MGQPRKRSYSRAANTNGVPTVLARRPAEKANKEMGAPSQPPPTLGSSRRQRRGEENLARATLCPSPAGGVIQSINYLSPAIKELKPGLMRPGKAHQIL